MSTRLEIIKPDDWHLHLREGVMLSQVLPYTVAQCARALIMPNLKDQPVLTAKDASDYYEQIRSAAKKSGYPDFKPYMTIQIVPNTSVGIIGNAKKSGVLAGKIYPRGLTTNSENGVIDYRALARVFKRMEEEDMVLCLHGEHPGPQHEGLFKEKAFADLIIPYILDTFPNLRVVMEHVTNASSVAMIKNLSREGAKIAGTITVHHLCLTIDDVIGYGPQSQGKMMSHHFCKPVAKFLADKEVLRQTAFSGHPSFFLGTDSAPHKISAKECSLCCAGIFTAPVALPLLATLFEEAHSLQNLESFTSKNGANFYQVGVNTQTITLIKEDFEVPETIGDIKVFKGKEILPWSVSMD